MIFLLSSTWLKISKKVNSGKNIPVPRKVELHNCWISCVVKLSWWGCHGYGSVCHFDCFSYYCQRLVSRIIHGNHGNKLEKSLSGIVLWAVNIFLNVLLYLLDTIYTSQCYIQFSKQIKPYIRFNLFRKDCVAICNRTPRLSRFLSLIINNFN